MIQPTLIDLNPDELNYYLLIVSLDQFSWYSNFADDLSTKVCVPSKKKRNKWLTYLIWQQE